VRRWLIWIPFIFIGCGTDEDRGTVAKLGDCVVKEMERGGGANSSYETSLAVACPGKSPETVFTGRHMVKMKVVGEPWKLKISMVDGQVYFFRNFLYDHKNNRIRIELRVQLDK